MPVPTWDDTLIRSNGSKFAGEAPDPIEKLFTVLGKYRLREHSCICEKSTSWQFTGNFEEISHVFDIETSNKVLVIRLGKLIRDNWRRNANPA